MDDWFYLENNSSQAQIPSENEFLTWINATLLTTGNSQRSIALRLVDRQSMQAMNLQFRGLDKPTNVLSFPFAPVIAEQNELSWGDIAICAPIVEQEANEQGKPRLSHWAHLTIHGTLHLLGYGHIVQQNAEVMEPLEISILHKLGYENPY